jgi:beta-glucosidase
MMADPPCARAEHLRRRISSVGAMALLVLAGCESASPPDAALDAGTDAGRDYVPEPFDPTAATMAYCDGDDVAIEARITELLADLTLREKIQLMHGARIALVDGVWLVEGVDRLGVPGLHMLDGPRGLSSFTDKTGTAFPVAMMRGATFDPELERRVGRAMAVEMRSAGADVILAPTINILRHPRWGRAQETYSEDVHHMGEMGVAFIEGAQSEGVIASAKHFAANSIEDTRHTVNVELDERTLREIYLPHFRRAVVEARVGSVMSAYNRVDGLYCDLNAHLLDEILKTEWEFAGFVESDWILGTHGDVESVRAGLDIEMPSDANFRRLARAVAAGEITEAELDASVRRILRAQFCFGLDARTRVLDDPTMRETPEHLALAREVARRGIVLLENDVPAGATEPVLPLDRAGTLVILGRNADRENIGDTGSSGVRPTDVATALEGIVAAAPGVTVTHLSGATLDAAGEAAVSAASAVIIVTGLTSDDEGEADISAGDRDNLAVPAEEVALIRAAAALNDRVIVALEGGAAFTVSDWVDDVQGLLMAFYPGSEGGHAIADVLFGDADPSGRLPFSVPVSEADLPAFDNTSDTVTYGYFHGYRHLQREGTAPQYPFGFGLSYASFDLTNLVVSPDPIAADGSMSASVDVTNTSAVRGRQTVQLYVGAVGSRVTRAPRELRAFAQVELAPGATETVTMTVDAADLAFWDEAAGAFEVEAIEYAVGVGTSAEDLPLVGTFRVE